MINQQPWDRDLSGATPGSATLQRFSQAQKSQWPPQQENGTLHSLAFLRNMGLP